MAVRELWQNGQLVGTEDVPDPEPDVSVSVDRYAAAEEARRAAYDAVLAGKTRTLALMDQANRAGSDAFLNALA